MKQRKDRFIEICTNKVKIPFDEDFSDIEYL